MLMLWLYVIAPKHLVVYTSKKFHKKQQVNTTVGKSNGVTWLSGYFFFAEYILFYYVLDVGNSIITQRSFFAKFGSGN